MASVTNRNMQQENNYVHCSNRLFLDWGHGLWSIQTCYTIWHTAGTHTCASSVTLTPYIPSDKWWPLWQICTCNSKIIMGIVATASLWLQGMQNEQYRPVLPFHTLLVPILVLLQSLWLHSSPVATDGVSDKFDHATEKWLWALQQRPLCLVTMQLK